MEQLREIVKKCFLKILLESENEDFKLGFITTPTNSKKSYYEVLYSKEPIGFFHGASPFGDFVFFSKEKIKNLAKFDLIQTHGKLMNGFSFGDCKFSVSKYDNWIDKNNDEYKFRYSVIPDYVLRTGSGQYSCEPGKKLVKKGEKLVCTVDKELKNEFEKEINNSIALIEKTYNDNLSYKELIKLFFDVQDSLKRITLNQFQDIIKKSYSKKYKKFNHFFVKTHNLIREKSKKNKEWKKNINAIIKNNNQFSAKDYYKIDKAYEDTLDEYKGDWSGYWSLIEVEKSGEIKGVYLGDTADREYFYNNYRKANNEYK